MSAELIEKALEISQKRRAILSRMREAVRSDDRDTVMDLARKLTGLGDDEERNRTDSRIN